MNDRQEKIYQILCKQGNASLSQLRQEIFASDATLRRDLSIMEQEGLLIRRWGGAVSTKNINSDPPVFLRSSENINEKKTIARIAASFLRDNMTVFLASGTTVTRLAKLLHRFKNLTIITNGIDTAEALCNHTSAKVILTGGELYENYDTVGPLTENAINSFNADIFFFSCSGILAELVGERENFKLFSSSESFKNAQTRCSFFSVYKNFCLVHNIIPQLRIYA